MATDLEMLQGIVSDLYKEAHGFRPRGETYWSTLTTVEACEAELDRLSVLAQDVLAWERECEARAAEELEAKIAELIDLGAGDRETALRWLRESVDADSAGEFEYVFGLRYGYLSEAAA